jgi:hypothetical protein
VVLAKHKVLAARSEPSGRLIGCLASSPVCSSKQNYYAHSERQLRIDPPQTAPHLLIAKAALEVAAVQGGLGLRFDRVRCNQ